MPERQATEWIPALIGFFLGGGVLRYMTWWAENRKLNRSEYRVTIDAHIKRLEDRIAKLEADMKEKDRIILDQANLIGVQRGHLASVEAQLKEYKEDGHDDQS